MRLFREALHDAARATITGEPLARDTAVADVMEIRLAAYSVVIFASVARTLRAFFLGERRRGVGDDAEGRLS